MSKPGKPVVLITGALTGICRATALAFAEAGANIVISGRTDDEGRLLEGKLIDLGADTLYLHADVRFEKDIKYLINETVARFGRLDVAVNNAGIEGSHDHISAQTIDNFHNVFDTNVVGVFLSMKHQIQQMLQQQHGSIINVSSVAGRIAFPGASTYVASKHAVDGLTKSAALEVAGSGIRINAVSPGFIDTDMFNRSTQNNVHLQDAIKNSVPKRRLGRPEEIADLILFLASDKSTYFTGQSVVIDGGYSIQ